MESMQNLCATNLHAMTILSGGDDRGQARVSFKPHGKVNFSAQNSGKPQESDR
jgi:hypothetical protein